MKLKVKRTMNKKAMMCTAVTFLLLTAGSTVQAQTNVVNRTYSDYAVRTNMPNATEEVAAAQSDGGVEEAPQQDLISSCFRYQSMCDWTPGMRFMVVPDNRSILSRVFTDLSTNLTVSITSLKHEVMIYDGVSRPTGRDRMDFHLQRDPSKKYYFELPTASFDDYCYSRQGVPSLAYLGDVDMAIDSLVGKQVRVLTRHFMQDSPVSSEGAVPVDIGDEMRGQMMTITKVGVGTRSYPVKIIIQDRNGHEYFQNVAISRTNSGLRDDEFERSDIREHSFRDIFQLLSDRMAVSSDLQAWVGKKVYAQADTDMRDANEKTVRVRRLSTFTVTDIYRFDDPNKVTLCLQGNTSNQLYTKEVSLVDRQNNGRVELLSKLFAEGDPENMPNVNKTNLSDIRAGKVNLRFTEAEVRLALGEPSEVTPVRNGQYQWIYQYVDTGRPFRSVTFNASNKRVRNAVR